MDRRFIFTVTTGRSGTGYLAYVLGLLRDVYSCHEPRPNYVTVMRNAQSDPGVAKRFLLERKVPHLAKSVSEPIYFESNHLY
jgi:hypothetical protein